MRKKINLSFILIMFICTFFPALFAHREIDRVADMENRYYANPPVIYDENGFNTSFNSEFDSFISDNVRGRSLLVILNSRLQYLLFGRLTNSSIKANDEGEIFDSTSDHISSFQVSNPYTDDETAHYASSLQKLSDHLGEMGIDFYYMQTYTKETIYPEKYFKGINRFSTETNALKVGKEIQTATDVKMIPIYDLMIAHKDEDIYYKITDTIHWNQAGAYIGYRSIMDTMTKDHPSLNSLNEDDYEIGTLESTLNTFGLHYPIPEVEPTYTIADPKAVEKTDELDEDFIAKLTYKEHTHYYTNDSCGNDLKILLINDSFIRMFLKDDIAESFSETLSIHWDNLQKLDEVLDYYHPDIVLLETADVPSALDTVVPYVNNYSDNLE